MGTKIKISVDKGADHSIRATRTARPTGQEYESEDLGAGDSHEFTVGAEEIVQITTGAPIEKTEEDTASKKK